MMSIPYSRPRSNPFLLTLGDLRSQNKQIRSNSLHIAFEHILLTRANTDARKTTQVQFVQCVRNAPLYAGRLAMPQRTVAVYPAAKYLRSTYTGPFTALSKRAYSTLGGLRCHNELSERILLRHVRDRFTQISIVGRRKTTRPPPVRCNAILRSTVPDDRMNR